MPLYSVLLKPVRENFLQTITPEEAAAVSAHFQYYKGLLEKKILHFAGRTVSATFGLALISADDIASLEKLLHADPAIINGVFDFEYDLFSVALLDTDPLNDYAAT